MSLLQGLKVVSSKRPVRLSPIQYRRNKLIDKLHEQLECAKAKAEGRECLFTRLRTRRNSETGQRFQMELQYRVKPWWYVNGEGKTVIEIRYGSRLIEITKGKTGVELEKPENLIATLELLKKAVDAGELDEGITSAIGEFGRGIKKVSGSSR